MSNKVIPTNFDNIEDNLENVTTDLKKFYKGWKHFVFKENVIHIAIGMIMANYFQQVTKSLVNDIIMPLFFGLGFGTHTENMFVILSKGNSNNATYITTEDAKNDGAVTLNYGIFISVFTNLIFISICLYFILRLIAKIKK